MRNKVIWNRISFSIILALSAFLNFFKLGQEGYANLYYAAGVKSMSSDLRNFFFNSFDPGGFVSIDKPPLGFWIQAASVKMLGFSGFSLIFPQALAGVLSVAVLYYIVKKHFGGTAGLLASSVLALTPIFVAISRNNTIDGLLVLFLLIGTVFLDKAAEKGSFGWLTLAMVMVGLGFNIKMLQAYMVLPAFIIVYLFSNAIPIYKRIFHLFAGFIILLAVSLSWAVAVDATPADKRPYVGSSRSNSVFDLIIGYNGLNRIGRFSGFLQRMQPGQPQPLPRQTPRQQIPPPQLNGPADEAGEPGIFRLFNRKVGGQISWLLTIALISAALCTWYLIPSKAERNKKRSLLFWSTWLITMYIFFSFRQGIFHRYYLAMLAPSIAAMVGIGFAVIYKTMIEKTKTLRKFIVLPFVMLAGAAVQVKILLYDYFWSKWILIIVVALMLISFPALLLNFLLKRIRNDKVIAGSMAIGIMALLIAPAAWSLTPIIYGGNAALPITGPELARSGVNNRPGSKPGAVMPNMDMGINIRKLTEYLLKNNSGEKFIAAVPSATKLGSKLILETGKPVMALGGFSGGDMILTVPKLTELVEKGTVRFFIIELNNQERRPGVWQWIKDNGRLVPNEEWQEIKNNRPLNMPEGFRLYDMK